MCGINGRLQGHKSSQGRRRSVQNTLFPLRTFNPTNTHQYVLLAEFGREMFIQGKYVEPFLPDPSRTLIPPG